MTKEEIKTQVTIMVDAYYEACENEGIEEGLEPNSADFLLSAYIVLEIDDEDNQKSQVLLNQYINGERSMF